jgi:hypothetical protein
MEARPMIDARTIELLRIQLHWGGRLRHSPRPGDGVRAAGRPRPCQGGSTLQRRSYGTSGREYRPPSPTSEFSAPVDLNAGFNVGLSIAARTASPPR